MRKSFVLTFCISVAFAVTVQAKDGDLDPDTAAGKLIYEGVTNRIGCERCHAADGTAHEEGKTFAAERSIQGSTAQEIRIAIMATPMMWSIKLTDEELDQVANYLKHLEETDG